MLRYLLSDNNFFEIEAPLRKEILSLDGATVVSPDGSFYCAGSIVSVPAGVLTEGVLQRQKDLLL